MSNVIKTTFQFKRGLAEAWKQVNPVLQIGEPGFESDTNKLKIGNGINTWNELEYVGDVKLSADGQSIVIEDNMIALAGFGLAEKGAQLRKGEAGLEWFIPVDLTENIRTLENITNNLTQQVTNIELAIFGTEGETPLPEKVTVIEQDIVNIHNTIGVVEENTTLVEMIEEAKYDDSSVLRSIEGIKGEISGIDATLKLKANAEDVYTKVETDAVIANAIAEASHLTREIVDELPEVGQINVIYMIQKPNSEEGNFYDEFMYLNNTWEKIGDTKVDLALYAKTEEVVAGLALKVDKLDGHRLMSDAEGIKLAAIEEGAEVNKINSVSAEFNIGENRVLSLVSVDKSKVTGLSEELALKINESDLEAWITENRGTTPGLLSILNEQKLNSIEENAQVNVIEGIKLGETFAAITDKIISIPVATTTSLGLVKSSEEENHVTVQMDGTMRINKLNVKHLVQDEEDFLTLNAGDSDDWLA